jgi:hypothetical protein
MKIKELPARRSLLCQTNTQRRGWRFSFEIAKSHEGNPSNQKSMNRQLAEACSAKLMLEGEETLFISNHEVTLWWAIKPKNQRTVSLSKLAPPN